MESSQSDLPPSPDSSAPAPQPEWRDLGLDPVILEVIAKAGFTRPTPVQAQTIPIAIQGTDVIASAQTGTGKTASFVLPMVQQFRGRQGTFGLILAPTREIAQQIHATIEILGAPLGIRSIVLIGGIDMRHDTTALNTYPQIIVATPGRLCDHLDRGNIWLDYLEIIVLDEADRMLDMGFSAQLSRVMDDVPSNRQTMLFSATISPSVQRLADKILHKPERVSIGVPLSTAGGVEQRVLWMSEESKNRELQRIMRQEAGSIIVFTRSKDGATRVWRSLHSAGVYDATYIHSDRLQAHREQALAEFKEGKYRILIATDVAGRGIHIDNVAHVVNYDLPMEAENYVHRIGRTGRAGLSGKSTTFATQRDQGAIREIEKLIGKPIPAEYTSSYPRPENGASEQTGSAQNGGRGRGPSTSGGNRGGRGGSSGSGGSGRGRSGNSGAQRDSARHEERSGAEASAPAPVPTPSSSPRTVISPNPGGVPIVHPLAQAPDSNDLYQPADSDTQPLPVTAPTSPLPRTAPAPVTPRAQAPREGSGSRVLQPRSAAPSTPDSPDTQFQADQTAQTQSPKRPRRNNGRGRNGDSGSSGGRSGGNDSSGNGNGSAFPV